MTTCIPGSAIQRVMEIDGVVVPALIHNGGYYFINLPIYADGLVDAWALLDQPLFEAKVRSGWVTTRIPNGEAMSIHGLGWWQVEQGSWTLTPDGLIDLVRAKLRELNPGLRNLYDCNGATTKRVGKVSVSILGHQRSAPVRRMDESTLPSYTRGRSLSVFAEVARALYLADLRVFADGMIEIGRTPSPRLLSRDELVAEVAAGKIVSEPAEGQLVTVHGLGSFTVGRKRVATNIQQLLLEVADIVDEMNGRTNSHQRCLEALQRYVASPSEAARAALGRAYEAVPAHKRVFLGDMDTKDIPIRMIVYGEQELETWSHRIAARDAGITPLPSIVVPRPADGDD